jgi:hypothetical protein
VKATSNVVARRAVDQTSLAADRQQANRVSQDRDQAVADLKWIAAGSRVGVQMVVDLALPAVKVAADRHPTSVRISPAVARLQDLVAKLVDALPADQDLKVVADPTAHAPKAAAASSIATCVPDPMVADQPLPSVARAQVVATACGMAHAIAMTVIGCQHAMPASGSTRWNAN